MKHGGAVILAHKCGGITTKYVASGMDVKEFFEDEASTIKAHKCGGATIKAYICEGDNVKSVGMGWLLKSSWTMRALPSRITSIGGQLSWLQSMGVLLPSLCGIEWLLKR